MTQEATAQTVSETVAYLHSHLEDINIYSFGEEPEVQVDFHIPCDKEHPMLADTLAALVPCMGEQDHIATAFHAGEYVQLSLHKEPSQELGEAFLHEAVSKALEDQSIAALVAEQIAKNREAQIAAAKERMARLKALKEKTAD